MDGWIFGGRKREDIYTYTYIIHDFDSSILVN